MKQFTNYTWDIIIWIATEWTEECCGYITSGFYNINSLRRKRKKTRHNPFTKPKVGRKITKLVARPESFKTCLKLRHPNQHFRPFKNARRKKHEHPKCTHVASLDWQQTSKKRLLPNQPWKTEISSFTILNTDKEQQTSVQLEQ